jgi:endonuclease I
MKHFYFILFLISTNAFAQIPSGYYDSATGAGYTLKTQLKAIIDAANDGLTIEYQSIDNGYGGLYTTYETSDRDFYYENNGTVLDMYSEKPSGTDSYEFTYEIESPDDRDSGSGGTSEGQFYNREHIIPQSVFNSQSPPRSDAHFVVPSDKYVNAQRGNLPFGKVQNANYTSSNGSKRGNNLNSGYSAGFTGEVFEPIDEFKGDIARMYFYFATRYQDDIASYNSYAMFNGSSNQVFNSTFLNILYTWHVNDPVSTREIDRNNAIFVAQNNRNPFIDHPEYVQSIWSNLLSTKNISNLDFKFYPNPLKGDILNVDTNIDLKIEIFDILGKSILKQNLTNSSKQINTSNLNKGIYLIRLTSEKGSVTKKLIKN